MNIVHSSIFWKNLISNFCDIPELITLKYINKTSYRASGDTFQRIVDRVKNNKFVKIPPYMANKLYTYFAKNKEYDFMIRVSPFTRGVISYRIFINLDIKNATSLWNSIKHNPSLLVSSIQKSVWYSPYHIAKHTFGLNLEVFKYAIDMCIVYGLTYLLENFTIDTEEDIIFLEYIENNVLR